MQASETKFQPIIEGTKQYVVPLFQRSYSWDKRQWDVLWGDILLLYEQENPRPHFMGSIVTMPTVSVPQGVAKYLLIDGQQRLTTIFILLSLLRDKARQNKQEKLAEKINNSFLINSYENDTDQYKLLPTQSDRKAYQQIILNTPNPYPSQVLECYKFFERKVRQNSSDLERLLRLISNDLSIVSIVLSTDDNPHLVFESLNAKGRPLTQADLIRNYFFMRIHINEQEIVYSQYWEPMQRSLANNLTECIRHYLMKDGTVINQNDVYFALKERIGNNDALGYLKDLSKFANYYWKLISPEYEKDKNIGNCSTQRE